MEIRYLILFWILGMTQVVAVAQRTENDDEANESIENLIQHNKVVGVSAGYSVDGDTKWKSAKGYADKDNKKDFELNTATRIASISKTMTAIAIMQLFEQKLKLDDPVDTYITNFPQKGQTKITIRHLLSHTSGIDGYKNAKEAESKTNYPKLSNAVNVFKDRKLLFEPGTKYHYSTYGYVVLGLIIERISGLTFEKYMQKNIWDKAGMKNTGIDKVSLNLAKKSKLYSKSNKGKIKEALQNNLSNRIPGGGFYSNLEDMLKFGNAILSNQLISKKTFKLMTQHHSLEKENNAYGFGWFLFGQKPNEGTIIGHSGEQTGASAFLFITPETKTVVVALSNTSGALNDIGQLSNTLLGLSQKKK